MSKFLNKFNSNDIKAKMSAKAYGKKYEKDDRFWKLKVDNHKGAATIRFLPDPDTGMYWKEYMLHANKHQGRWLISNCPKTNGWEEACPVCDKAEEFRQGAFPSDKANYDKWKRQKRFVANILVIQDKANPENEGKVFLFEFKAQVKNMIQEEIYGHKDLPKEEIEEMVKNGELTLYEPSDFNTGADFVYRAAPKNINGDSAHDYVTSRFKAQTALFGDLDDEERGEKIDEIMEQAHELEKVPAKDTYLDAGALRKKFAPMLGVVEAPKKESAQEGTFYGDDTPSKPTPKKKVVEEDSAEEDDLDDFLDSLDED